ncbi:hypothetical protein PsorP6_005333 [Peronosclerospora sorghi]|uniref:Uncharacterized protein n=1 Tax=Peronosclerospora sorghi TaxID=230839 RepID=A0ACC0W2Z0_9STRA|nr:hypothetical protein PsorP6_005333 [Peronosclerospora sorghi]
MTDASGAVTKEEKRNYLLAAMNRHVARLLLVAPGERVPFLEDPVVATSGRWLVSTSHLSHERFDGWGWGEVVPDGLGIAYSVKDECMQFNIACRQQGNWSARMGHLLEENLVEMHQLFAPPRELGAKL